MIDLRVNQRITTPNGPGTVESLMYADGCRYLIVRHIIREMTSKQFGKSMTPKAVISGLWAYELGPNGELVIA